MKKSHKWTWRQLVALGIGSMFWVGAIAQSVSFVFPTSKTARQAQPYVPGELLVKFRAGISELSQQQSLTTLGAQRSRALGNTGWTQVQLAPGQSVIQQVVTFQNDSAVELAEPNYIYRILAAPNEPNYGQLWALRNTGAPVSTTPQPGHSLYSPNSGTAGRDMAMEAAWDHITDCSAIPVAVIDTGVIHDHADIAANMWNGGGSFPNHGFDFVGTNDNDPRDRNGHGTHVAGTIGAIGNNNTGTVGVCWSANIMAVRVLDAAGSGSTADIIEGIDFAIARSARVINMSLGSGSFSQAFSDAITRAQNAGIVVVVAAGNSGSDNDGTPTYPCSFNHSNLVCVAALDQSYNLTSFSNYGATSVDVGAPGANVLSTWAGTNAVIADPLTSGWTFSTTTAGNGWGFGSGGLAGFLLNPFNYDGVNAAPTTFYKAGTDDRAYKMFNVSGVDEAFLEYADAIDMFSGDFYRINFHAGGTDPFAGGTPLMVWSAGSDFPLLFFNSWNIGGCRTATCAIGFQLQTNVGGQDRGIAITDFEIRTLTLNTSSFNTISGTSMASPHVAGLAAMLLAYNPSFNYSDVVGAIKNGGTSVAALGGVTTTGRAVSGIGSITYINPPGGLTATIQ